MQRIQRDLLPDGITSREEAEILIGLDRTTRKADPAWAQFLVSAIVDFVVWGERPTGIVDEATARWLAHTFVGDAGQPATKTARLIVREIAEETLGFENNALSALASAGGSSASHTKASAPVELTPAPLAA